MDPILLILETHSRKNLRVRGSETKVYLLLTPLKSFGLDDSQLCPCHCYLEEAVIHSFIYSIIYSTKYLLSTYYIPGTVLITTHLQDTQEILSE